MYLLFGRKHLVQHIIITGDAHPIHQALKILHVENIIKEKGVVEESNNSRSSPSVLVNKKEEPPRFCVDYRKTNDNTK